MNDIKTCAVDECERPAKSRGWCIRHYTRHRRYGSPTAGPQRRTVRERIEPRIVKGDGCWAWLGGHDNKGYSVLRVRSGGSERTVLIHREVLSWTLGPLPPYMDVDHVCHNPACVNPDHLRLATRKQNIENYAGLRRDNTSGYRGAYRKGGRWVASVGHNGGTVRVRGSFDTAEEAAEAARKLRLQLHTHNDADRAA